MEKRIMLQSFLAYIVLFAAISQATASQAGERPRARDIGLEVGIFRPGPLDAITDVRGIKVGHVTLISGESVRTGVTAIIPHGENIFNEKVPAAIIVGNGFGKLVGFTQVEELGELETPIVLTNTLSVWDAAQALVEYTLSQRENERVRSVNPVAGETNDAFLNDIRGFHVKKEHVIEALRNAQAGRVQEGAIGAGTGTVCMGWKGGIGTASRVLPSSLGGHTVGVLVQTNFGGILQIGGVPVGKELGRYYLKDKINEGKEENDRDGGSCMIVIATDAPLDARQLHRVAKRALLALGVVGSSMSHGSGDYVIAFSTAPSARIHRDTLRTRTLTILSDEALSPIFQAVVEATEEAIYNSLFKATTTTGVDGHTVEALPIEKVKEVLKKYGRMK